MRQMRSFNEGWVFHAGFAPTLVDAPAEGQGVSLPHNAVDLPFSYFDEAAYQRAFTYQKSFDAEPDWRDKEVGLVFDGAMADAKVYLNGVEIAAHKDGYTPFEARLSGGLRERGNLLCVTIDGGENPAIPPFGGAIDYLTYAGIYRDVWLRVSAPIYIADVKIETPDALAAKKSVRARIRIANPLGLALAGQVKASLRETGGRVLRVVHAPLEGLSAAIAMDGLEGIALWDIDRPSLYGLEVELAAASGPDAVSVSFGFRTAQFTPQGFRLNGRALKLRGLNRHQSFPYVGYAMGRAAQERDAQILKRELKCNLVRTSHYPQSKYFLDECDRIGLLAFEEIPGWQHIGDAAWQAEAIENVKRMITRDWNHPCIVLWGVRINESPDNDAFYAATNALARQLDATRQTGGVRCIANSRLLEDVYTMNDFILGEEELAGRNRPRTALRRQGEVTGLTHIAPYLITEFGGHMYPTKSFDQEQRQAEHVRRHLEVLNAAYGDAEISGAIGWCMFDYNTHKDFGSGDRICHHGVMDMFREPKFAAYVYASQCDPSEEVILKPVTFWARGERNIGGVLPLIVLTNCDEVEIRYGDNPPKRIGRDRENFPFLPHPPVVIDRRHFSEAELGQWGMRWREGRFTGFIAGKPAKHVHLAADPIATRLEVVADRAEIAAEGRDSVRVMVRALDQLGAKLPFLQEPVAIALSGPGRRLGPALVPLRGGSTGFWLESTGARGDIEIAVTSSRLGTTRIMVAAR